jgi:AraC family transcriptional regulator
MTCVLISEHGRLSTTLRRLATGDFIIGLYRIGQTRALAQPHVHPRASLSLILEGVGLTRFSRCQSRCEPGVIEVEPAGVPHSHELESRELLWCTLEVAGPRADSVPDLARRLRTPGTFDDDGPVRIFRRLVDELSRAGAWQAMTVEGLALELLGSMICGLNGGSGGRPIPIWLQGAFAGLDECSAHRVRLADVAAQAGVHPAHFAREFRRHTGVSFGEFARQRRVGIAERLLAESALSLSAIAQECGFADQSHFTRVFVRQKGQTPGAFRARHDRRDREGTRQATPQPGPRPRGPAQQGPARF